MGSRRGKLANCRSWRRAFACWALKCHGRLNNHKSRPQGNRWGKRRGGNGPTTVTAAGRGGRRRSAAGGRWRGGGGAVEEGADLDEAVAEGLGAGDLGGEGGEGRGVRMADGDCGAAGAG